MCGIPYHASRVYIARLLRAGKKIAICEQVTVNAPGKGLAERKVVEVITPGTAVDEDYLESGINNFLACRITSYNVCYTKLLRSPRRHPVRSGGRTTVRRGPCRIRGSVVARPWALLGWGRGGCGAIPHPHRVTAPASSPGSEYRNNFV